MSLIRKTMLACSVGLFLTFSMPISNAAEGNFKDYADGAMLIYSKFKQPSKTESEQFYSYIKSRWESENCEYCILPGKKAAEEYAVLRKVELDHNGI